MIDLDKLVEYDETSPSCLRWHKDIVCSTRHPSNFGSVVGKVSGDKKKGFYYRASVRQKTYPVHRLIWWLHGRVLQEGEVIDQIDGNSLNNKIENLRAIPRGVNNMNFKMYSTNNTGKTGVNMIANGQGNFYYMAHWSNFENKVCRRYFSIEKLGVMVAFRDAVIYRQNMIATLNEQGAGYTERHGK